MTFGTVFRLLEKRLSYINEFITAAKERETTTKTKTKQNK